MLVGSLASDKARWRPKVAMITRNELVQPIQRFRSYTEKLPSEKRVVGQHAEDRSGRCAVVRSRGPARRRPLATRARPPLCAADPQGTRGEGGRAAGVVCGRRSRALFTRHPHPLTPRTRRPIHPPRAAHQHPCTRSHTLATATHIHASHVAAHTQSYPHIHTSSHAHISTHPTRIHTYPHIPTQIWTYPHISARTGTHPLMSTHRTCPHKYHIPHIHTFPHIFT